MSVRASLAATNIQAWSGYHSTKVSRLWGGLFCWDLVEASLPATGYDARELGGDEIHVSDRRRLI